MKATRNGWTIEGTPAEIHELIEMSAGTDTLTAKEPEMSANTGTLIKADADTQPRTDLPTETDTQPTGQAAKKHRSNSAAETPEQNAKLDIGKIKALHEAGWSIKQIADEMGVSYQTIYQRMKNFAKNRK